MHCFIVSTVEFVQVNVGCLGSLFYLFVWIILLRLWLLFQEPPLSLLSALHLDHNDFQEDEAFIHAMFEILACCKKLCELNIQSCGINRNVFKERSPLISAFKGNVYRYVRNSWNIWLFILLKGWLFEGCVLEISHLVGLRTQYFPKNWHFWPPDTHSRVRIRG